MSPAREVLVVDASVAAKWHLPEADEAHADLALSVLGRFREGTIDLIAPGHIRFEVPSALTVAAAVSTSPRLTAEAAQAQVDAFLALPLVTFDETQLLSAAVPLALQHRIAFYDAVYLALAIREEVHLITADRKCYSRIAHLSQVVWLGDWSPPI